MTLRRPALRLRPESGIEQFKSILAAPIMDEDQCLGVIFVLSATVWIATSSDITLLTTTANQISGVIKNARMFQNIQDRLSALEPSTRSAWRLPPRSTSRPLLSLIAKNSTHSLRAQGAPYGS